MYIKLGSVGDADDGVFATLVRSKLACKFSANELNQRQLSKSKFICTGFT